MFNLGGGCQGFSVGFFISDHCILEDTAKFWGLSIDSSTLTGPSSAFLEQELQEIYTAA